MSESKVGGRSIKGAAYISPSLCSQNTRSCFPPRRGCVVLRAARCARDDSLMDPCLAGAGTRRIGMDAAAGRAEEPPQARPNPRQNAEKWRPVHQVALDRGAGVFVVHTSWAARAAAASLRSLSLPLVWRGAAGAAAAAPRVWRGPAGRGPTATLLAIICLLFKVSRTQ